MSGGRRRILVAMSGGVDSAVAAARLVDDGHEVIGATLHLWDYEATGTHHGRCCAPEDQYDARRTADALGFAHYTFDRREAFARTVVAPFVDAYLSGETPSPCTSCNRGVKLAELFDVADRLGADAVATGHYARVGRDAASGEPFLRAGADAHKDQSYFLYATPRAWLERFVFPLGDSTKAEVRAEAVARRLPGAGKGESQELCFVGEGAGAYAAFVEGRAPDRVRPGEIVDAEGRIVARHGGVHRFTVGQRKGLGVALGKPAFVARIDAETATVHLSEGAAPEVERAELDDVVLAPGIALPLEGIGVRVRYRHAPARATVVASTTSTARVTAAVRFESAVRSVSRGQIAVFYDGERVLGGGRIV